MRKYIIHIAGLLLIVALMSLVISQRQLIARLRERAKSQSEKNEQLAALVAENVRRTQLDGQNIPAEALATGATNEVLRLRGEVARLYRDQADVGELRKQIETLRIENHQLRGQTLNDTYFFSGLDTNSLPEIELGLPREEVSAELQRVGAKVLCEGDTYVQAEAHPAVVGNSNASLATVKMEFYFENGKLTSRKDWPSIPQ